MNICKIPIKSVLLQANPCYLVEGDIKSLKIDNSYT